MAEKDGWDAMVETQCRINDRLMETHASLQSISEKLTAFGSQMTKNFESLNSSLQMLFPKAKVFPVADYGMATNDPGNAGDWTPVVQLEINPSVSEAFHQPVNSRVLQSLIGRREVVYSEKNVDALKVFDDLSEHLDATTPPDLSIKTGGQMLPAFKMFEEMSMLSKGFNEGGDPTSNFQYGNYCITLTAETLSESMGKLSNIELSTSVFGKMKKLDAFKVFDETSNDERDALTIETHLNILSLVDMISNELVLYGIKLIAKVWDPGPCSQALPSLNVHSILCHSDGYAESITSEPEGFYARISDNFEEEDVDSNDYDMFNNAKNIYEQEVQSKLELANKAVSSATNACQRNMVRGHSKDNLRVTVDMGYFLEVSKMSFGCDEVLSAFRMQSQKVAQELPPRTLSIESHMSMLCLQKNLRDKMTGYTTSVQNVCQTFVAYDACFRLCLDATLQVEVKKICIIPQRRRPKATSFQRALHMQGGAECVRQVAAIMNTQSHSLKVASSPIAPEETLSGLLQLKTSSECIDSFYVVCLKPGDGGKFSGGFDINVFKEVHTTCEALLPGVSIDLVANTIEDGWKPSMAAIQGLALDGGLELTMGCHARISASEVQHGLPELTRAVISDFGGTQHLPRLFGVQKVLEMIMLSKTILAKEGKEGAMIDAITSREELIRVPRLWALEIAERCKPWNNSIHRIDKLTSLSEAREILKAVRQQAKKTNPHLPQYQACLDTIEEGIVSGGYAGVLKEANVPKELMFPNTSRGLIHAIFFPACHFKGARCY